VTNTFVLLDGGKTKLLGDFIRELGNPEAVKKCLQGLAYNSDTKFYKKGEEEKNSALLNFLNNDEISSEFKGNVNELVQVTSLVEPPLKRFTDLLITSDVAARPEFAGAVDAVEAGTPSARRVGEPQPAGDAATVGPDNASVGQGVSQVQPNISELPASTLNIPVEEQDQENALRELSRLLKQEADFIRREVSSSEEAEPENGNRESTEDDDVQLVKEWLQKQFSSERLGVIREVVSEDSSESKTATGGDSRSDEGSTEERGRYKLSDFASVLDYSDKSKEELLSFIKERWISARQESGDSIKSNGNGSSFINTYLISDVKTYIEPCSRQFEKGLIDPKLIDQFYDVEEGGIGNCYDITELAEIDIDTNSQTFAVKSKGKLFLPPNHP
jgi:hypothetical protein